MRHVFQRDGETTTLRERQSSKTHLSLPELRHPQLLSGPCSTVDQLKNMVDVEWLAQELDVWQPGDITHGAHQDDHRGRTIVRRQDPAGEINAGHARHHHVADHEIGMEPLGDLPGLETIKCLSRPDTLHPQEGAPGTPRCELRRPRPGPSAVEGPLNAAVETLRALLDRPESWSPSAGNDRSSGPQLWSAAPHRSPAYPT